ncbi:hypothetical protein Csa_015729, partial [Cucumis sativus]
KMLSALVAKLHEGEEEEAPKEAHLGEMQYLDAMKVGPSSKELTWRGLLYVDTTLNDRAALALLDTGEWKGKVDFLLAPLDDSKIVLGLDFMKQAHAYVDATRKTLVFQQGEGGAPQMHRNDREGHTRNYEDKKTPQRERVA